MFVFIQYNILFTVIRVAGKESSDIYFGDNRWFYQSHFTKSYIKVSVFTYLQYISHRSFISPGATLTRVAGIQQCWAPPSSNQPGGLHIHSRNHIQSHWLRRRWCLVHWRWWIDIISHIALTIFLGITARVWAAFLAVSIVSLYVLCQVIRPHKPFITHWTRKTFFSRMCP